MRRSTFLPALALLLLAAPSLTSTPAMAAARETRDPVLLVHGFNGSGRSWHTMTQRLRALGYPDDSIDAISYDSAESNVDVARQIAGEVDALRARTGARKVDVIAHSMGSISARYYVERLGGADKVDAFASLAGVNRGTIWAVGCAMLVSCREMVPGSTLLDRLAPDVHADLPTRFATWWSPCDLTIVPQSNAELRGARNVETGCIGHSELKTDPWVAGQVLDFITQPYTPTA